MLSLLDSLKQFVSRSVSFQVGETESEQLLLGHDYWNWWSKSVLFILNGKPAGIKVIKAHSLLHKHLWLIILFKLHQGYFVAFIYIQLKGCLSFPYYYPQYNTFIILEFLLHIVMCACVERGQAEIEARHRSYFISRKWSWG